MRIMLIGARGQLAQEFVRETEQRGNHEIVALAHEQLDIRDSQRVEALVAQTRPECIVNTAAFHQVDRREEERELAFAVNQGGVRNVARAAERAKALLVQFSTDYVFDGSKTTPYLETDEAKPLSVYGRSRLAGEKAVAEECSRYLLIRTCGLYGRAGSASKAGNFVETMLRLAGQKKPLRVVNDQVCTPTSTRHLAQHLLPLVAAAAAGKAQGLFHMTSSGECSWYQFAQEVFRLAGFQAALSPCSSEEYNAKARRPRYSVLENRALKTAGFTALQPWQEALAEYIRSR